MTLCRAGALCAFLVASLPARATTIQVTTRDDERTVDGDCSLREAIEAANRNVAIDACPAGSGPSADTVLFTAIAGQTIGLTLGQIEVSDGIVIGGPDARVTIDAGGTGRAFQFYVTVGPRLVSLVNLTVRNGRGTPGGAVLVIGGVETAFTGVTFTNNTSTGPGGALRLAVGTNTLTDCTFIQNSSTASGPDDGGGAIYLFGGVLNVLGGVMRENTTAGSGGAVYLGGNATLVVGRSSQNRTAFVLNVAARGGGAVEHSGTTAQFTDTSFNSNRATSGGGLSLGGLATALIGGVTFLANEARSSGGGLWLPAGGTAVLLNTYFSSNTAFGTGDGQGGGGIFSDGGIVTLTNVDLFANDAEAGGGVFNARAGRLTMTNGSVSTNTARRTGGGIETSAAPGQAGNFVRLTDVTLRMNAAGSASGFGGGLHIAGVGAADISGGAFVANTAVAGGGVWKSSGGVLAVRGTRFEGNTASGAGGGGVYNEGEGEPLVLTGVTLLRNAASGAEGAGGALYNGAGGTVTLADAVVQENTAGAVGGGLWSSPTGTLIVGTTTVQNNTAPRGGGVFKQGSGGAVEIDRSLLRGNAASTAGGGLYSAGGFVTVRNSTVSGNTAGDGGGAFVAAGRLSLLSATVARNVATGTGGGLRAVGGTVLIGNTVVGDNRVPGDSTAAGSDCAGLVTGSGVYVMEVTAGCSFTVRSPVRGDARMLPLANNGGPTATHALSPGSPAARAGQTTEPVDQRGFTRTGTPSVGAYEVGGTPVVVATESGHLAARPALSPPAPNPVRGASRMTVSTSQSGPVLIALHDTLGRRVQTVFDGTAVAGVSFDVEIDGHRLAPGVYIVRLSAAGETSAQRVTVVR